MRRTRQDLQPSLFPDDVFPLCIPQAKTAAQTDIPPSVTSSAADPQAAKEISGGTSQDVSAGKAEVRYKFKPQVDTRAEAEVGIPTETELSADPSTEEYPTRDFGDLFERLSRSGFRSRFHLSPRDRDYFQSKGPATIRHHAEDFILRRLAPVQIPNDGRQTPMRGHPVFTAQHATACCCRGCFAKWHHIPAHRPLTPDEQRYAVDVIMAWLLREIKPR